MIARHGLELAEAAEAAGVPLKFEAAVAGGIPVIKGLREGAAANVIDRVQGILNGTCNFILSTMEDTGRDFADVLAEAQAMGFAEADPTLDIEGIDAGHKLAILAAMGAVDMVSVFIRSSLVQLFTPDDKRGRVSSISGLAISASNELGEMQSGLAAAILGATGAVVFGGAGAIVVTLVWAWYFPELRRANSFEPQALKREVST